MVIRMMTDIETLGSVVTLIYMSVYVHDGLDCCISGLDFFRGGE